MQKLLPLIVAISLTGCLLNVERPLDLSQAKIRQEAPLDRPTATVVPISTNDAGKVAVRFNLPEDLIFETQGFHTQATLDDVSGALLTVTSTRLRVPLAREFTKEEINSNSRIIIDKLPVGTVHVDIKLLDQKKETLVEDSQEAKVKANEVTPVEFNLTLVNDTPRPGEQTGAIAVSVNVKEETPVFGQLRTQQTTVKVGESVSLQVHNLTGEINRYRFNPGDDSQEIVTPDPLLQHVYTIPGKYKARVKIEGIDGKSYQDELVIIVKGNVAVVSTPLPKHSEVPAPEPTSISESMAPTPNSTPTPEANELPLTPATGA